VSRASKRFLAWSLLAIIIAALFPVALAFLAGMIASVAGCTLSGGGPDPCIIFGADWGGALSVMLTMHWLAFLTLPAGALALAVWAVCAFVLWWRSRSS
jgi:hypothetical protein